MNRDEFESKISSLVEEAIDSNMIFIDIIAVLESCKMSIQIIMHESTRRAKVI